jgi:hypothetical protein
MFICFLFRTFAENDLKNKIQMNILKNIILNLILAVVIVVVLALSIAIWLNVYTGQGESVEIPNVKSMKPEVAQPLFEARELYCQIIDSTYDKTVRPGTIIETIPPVGSKVKKGRTIYIRLNSHSAGMVLIPDVRDLSQRQATIMLNTLGLKHIDIKWVPGIYRDLVVGLEYRGRRLQIKDQVPDGAIVTLLVSSGSADNEDNEVLVTNEEITEDPGNPFDF